MQGGAPDEEELLPQPRSHQDGTRAKRLRRDVGIAALALLAATLVGTAIAQHGGTDHHPGASTSGRPLELPAATDFVTLGPTGAAYLPETAVDAVTCPSHAVCTVRYQVSEPVRDAVEEAFPGAVITAAKTIRMTVQNFGSANWSLQVRAQEGDAQIVLDVRGLARSDRTRGYSRLLYGGRAITRYEAVLGPYYVLIQVITPADLRGPAGPMAQLARDIRLFEPW